MWCVGCKGALFGDSVEVDWQVTIVVEVIIAASTPIRREARTLRTNLPKHSMYKPRNSHPESTVPAGV